MKTKDLIDQKWDAIDSALKTMNAVRNDLFDNVALALSRMEGRLSFLNGENFDNEPFLEGQAQRVGIAVEQEIKDARKALDEIFVQLSEGRDNLLK